MLRLSLALAALAASTAIVHAQTADVTAGAGAAQSTMARLLADGYEIKGTAQASSRYIVFMQKEKTAYACQFVTVTTTRCGLITE
ncbi:hypothetical protein GGQ64_003141 [Rhizobium azooxidifex]|uniref:Uncharacterized protein n=1 Tax=Mycoplana azooxidifex TaxID=1636188 RepID=A0A7W6GK43_9HYPH|nr:hypothetical protein [Mycoplana azooxidifex]MBB3977927.1 hypothetical protein [Mycoplana azooxidifex]